MQAIDYPRHSLMKTSVGQATASMIGAVGRTEGVWGRRLAQLLFLPPSFQPIPTG